VWCVVVFFFFLHDVFFFMYSRVQEATPAPLSSLKGRGVQEASHQALSSSGSHRFSSPPNDAMATDPSMSMAE
jgi:hypothetical protein